MDELKTRIIRESYENIIDLLMEYQYSIPIGYNIEMYEYVSEVLVKNRRFNRSFFDERPDLLTEE